jgi:hypothetical protein
MNDADIRQMRRDILACFTNLKPDQFNNENLRPDPRGCALDTNIDAIVACTLAQTQHRHMEWTKTYIMPTTAFVQLTRENERMYPHEVEDAFHRHFKRRYSSRDGRSLLRSRTWVLFPICYGNRHWILFALYRAFDPLATHSPLAFVFDSKPRASCYSFKKAVFGALRVFIRCHAAVHGLTVHTSSEREMIAVDQSPRQAAGDETLCGFFMVLTMLRLLDTPEIPDEIVRCYVDDDPAAKRLPILNEYVNSDAASRIRAAMIAAAGDADDDDGYGAAEQG